MATTETPFAEALGQQVAPPAARGMMATLEAELNTPAAASVEPTGEDEAAPVVSPPVETQTPPSPPVDIEQEIENIQPKKDKAFNFRELEKRRNEAEAKLTEFQKQLEERDNKLKELNEQLEKVAFERSPTFQRDYLNPKLEAENLARDFVKDLELDESVVSKALGLKGKDRLAFIDETLGGGASAAEFLNLIRDVEYKSTRLNKAVEERQISIEQLTNLEESKDTELIEKNFQATAEELSKGLTLFREIDGDVNHNALVKSRLEQARAIVLGEADDRDIIIAPFLAVVAKEYIAKTRELTAELQKYKKRVGELNEAEPTVRGTKPTPSGKGGKPKGGIETILDNLK